MKLLFVSYRQLHLGWRDQAQRREPLAAARVPPGPPPAGLTGQTLPVPATRAWRAGESSSRPAGSIPEVALWLPAAVSMTGVQPQLP